MGSVNQSYVYHPKRPQTTNEDPCTCYLCAPPKIFISPEYFLKHREKVHGLPRSEEGSTPSSSP